MGGPVDVFVDVSVGNNCCRRMGQSRTKKLVKVLGIFEKKRLQCNCNHTPGEGDSLPSSIKFDFFPGLQSEGFL